MSKLIKRAYKFRFYPQEDLKIVLAKTFGCVRFVYNQTLDYSEKHYANKDKIENYKSLTSSDRVNYIKTLKNLTEEDIEKANYGQLKYSWLSDVSSIALQQSARHLNDAYSRFFKGQGKKPTFKSKHNNHNSFTITGKGSLHFNKDFNKSGSEGFKKFYIPKYDKPLNIKFSRKFNHLAVSSVTISQNPSGQYFISFLVEETIESKQAKNNKVSIDLGLKTHAKVYNGENFTDYNLPELLKNIDKKLRSSQKKLSRKTNGSNNKNKQRIKVARLHQKRNNIITDFYQKTSTQIVNENQTIMIENLAVKNMIKNRKLSRAIHNVAWSKFISMIEYKSQWNDRIVVKVDKFYPSSKTCSNCGHIYHGLKLSERHWQCSSCHANHDRDENACLNLFNYKQYTVGTTANACGGNIRPKVSKNINSMKLEAISNEAGIPLL